VAFWRKKSDGFKWVAYVPTQLRLRREARRNRLEQARIEIEGMAKYAAKKSWDGVRDGAGAAGRLSLDAAKKAPSAAGRALGAVAGAAGRAAGQAGEALQPVAVAALGAGGRIGKLAGERIFTPQVVQVLGGLGLLLLVGGAVRAYNGHPDLEARIALGLGAALSAAAFVPRLWRRFGPGIAGILAGALKTRSVKADGKGGGRPSLLLPGALGVLIIAALGGGGYWLMSRLLDHGPPITGRATASGPDTLRMSQQDIRLYGIAAPEAEQRCGDSGRRSRCGQDAQRVLSSYVNGRSVTCKPRGKDEAGRVLAQCSDGAEDIGARLVREGHVWAAQGDPAGYGAQEAKARSAKAGIWRSPTSPPWEWRDKAWAEAKRQAPDGCPVKAEVSGSERLYHLPWQASYERVKIGKAAEKRGTKRWFCSEREAIDAGYRPATDRG
jgi:endonuclease YncB( thermonuclease family)